MQVSARILGQDYGLNAQEMNRVLVKEGLLTGQPGDYSLTEKAMNFAKERNFHRGTGGYYWYNRYWTTRIFDDSIKELLNVTPELKEEVRNEIATERVARCVARAKADAEFLAKQATENATKEVAEIETGEFIRKCKKAGAVGLIVIGVATVCYGIYEVTPKVKKWWNEKNSKKEDLEGGEYNDQG